ncbi:hypothetical protein DRO58_08615 [Candidatus Bathyarchaeota archaeon]|nr:MAG: hypothetical protein DRO58_08615 [Candidatus Bathyarchaeota archaeon]
MGRVVKEELLKALRVEARKTMEDGDPKKIVREEELERYLAKGWDAQTEREDTHKESRIARAGRLLNSMVDQP